MEGARSPYQVAERPQAEKKNALELRCKVLNRQETASQQQVNYKKKNKKKKERKKEKKRKPKGKFYNSSAIINLWQILFLYSSHTPL